MTANTGAELTGVNDARYNPGCSDVNVWGTTQLSSASSHKIIMSSTPSPASDVSTEMRVMSKFGLCRMDVVQNVGSYRTQSTILIDRSRFNIYKL